MYKIQRTSKIKRAINSKKKLLEKTDLYDYALKFKDKIYLNVDFLTYGNKKKGTLILSKDGDIIPREEAIQALTFHSHFNNYIDGVINIMIPETRKSLKPFEEVVALFNELEVEGGLEFVNSTHHNFKRVLEIRKVQSEIIYKIRDIQNKVLDEVGYFTEEDLQAMREYCESFNVGQFKLARVRLDHIKDVEQTIYWLKENKSNNEKLIRLLEDSIGESTISILKKAYKEQSSDYYHKEVLYPPGEEGVKKYLEVYRDIVYQSTKDNVLPGLRN
ncbi:hypothetical protein [Sutcliffiella rhizosphaerae]|uniref:Uncharacterized protein n=1 Tax=Sutcliffiella rhizosphaerae TaxID=2880967 RepID=A0ABM8YK27_9BACI|nr:hypothetical protein [Sutcliffiella rhizosphaerae]CAG9620268.1 hypothetical protein BACCIP111883_01036 [Sutcliffiella rhizosphaerae]